MNTEDFGPDRLLGCASDREVMLTRILREKLAALNPGLPDTAFDDAIRQLAATIASQTLAAANREKTPPCHRHITASRQVNPLQPPAV